MGNEFIECPTCKKAKNGSTLYECSNCGHLMCYYSDGLPFSSSYGCWKGDRCPNCASHKKDNIQAIGKIYTR